MDRKKIAIAVGSVFVAVVVAVVAWWAIRDADCVRVVQYVSDKLHDPYFQKVQWWPAVETRTLRDAEIAEAKELLGRSRRALAHFRLKGDRENIAMFEEEIPALEERIRKHESAGLERVVRLKYRSKVKGEITLVDEVFRIDGPAISRQQFSGCKACLDLFPE